MILAAIFISPKYLPHVLGKDHEGITINLGGNYFYSITEDKEGKAILSEKAPNPSFIENFWGEQISLVSAIVGENGVGKTSIMSLFQLPSSYCSFVIEEGDEFHIQEHTDEWDVLYYSGFMTPHMYGAERDNFRDLSKYSMMIDDTEYESASLSPLMELHESENLKRWILFADLKNQHDLLKELNLPSFEKIRLRFNSFIVTDNDTSYAFRKFFKEIADKLDAEQLRREQEDNELRKLTSEQIENEPYIGNAIRLELRIIRAVVSKVHNILESTGNRYLGEGMFKNDFSLQSPQFAVEDSGQRAFYAFIDNAIVEPKKGKRISLPSKPIKALIEKLISLIPGDEKIENADDMEIDFKQTLEVMALYRDFLLAFRNDFTYDKKIMMQFMPNRRMSSGERGLYDLFSATYDATIRFQEGRHKDLGKFNKRKKISDRIMLLLDEGDLGFHPYWKKKYIGALLAAIPKLFPGKQVQIIITTHDPLTLSDFPRDNVVYLKREQQATSIYGSKDMRSFGANISTLLKNAFFVRDGLIGDFAKGKIEDLIKELNRCISIKEKEPKTKFEPQKLYEIRKLIQLVDEPIIQQKLIEMYGMISEDDELSRQINTMEMQLAQLKKQREEEK